MTLHGNLTYDRSVLIPADAESKERLLKEYGVKSVFPLDDALEISCLPFKMTASVMLRCAFWAQNQCSYQAAEDMILKTSGLKINDDTIRSVTNYVGELVFNEDCRRTDEICQMYDEGKLDFKHNKKGVLYIETDGAALNTRHKDQSGSTWRKNKLGVVYSSDHIHYWTNKKGEREHRIEQREYVSYVGSADEFRRHLFRCAVENGYGQYQETVVRSDGAAWIANLVEDLFPDAHHILDLFHLKENVCSYAKEKFHQDEALYIPWAEGINKQLENGQVDEVLSQLKPDEQYSNCVNLYYYLTVHHNHVDYPTYRENGWFSGSGAIENGNKIVLQKRLKQAGMRWDPQTAQYLLTLKSKYESGKWEQDVVNYVNETLRNRLEI